MGEGKAIVCFFGETIAGFSFFGMGVGWGEAIAVFGKRQLQPFPPIPYFCFFGRDRRVHLFGRAIAGIPPSPYLGSMPGGWVGGGMGGVGWGGERPLYVFGETIACSSFFGWVWDGGEAIAFFGKRPLQAFSPPPIPMFFRARFCSF